MNLDDLVQELQDDQITALNEPQVVIQTDKQLLPNANYDFELDLEDDRVVLRPTIRK